MTGAGHYSEAEACINSIRPSVLSNDADVIAWAQVHATLALAAATALSTSSGLPANDWDEWRNLASIKDRRP